ncbi:MAG: S-layer homology domain-containing protein [Nitriliruptoraceae bacterium]|nr:S-layer homology domain-containing protein [Nitriliruptoraceae bacterium]
MVTRLGSSLLALAILVPLLVVPASASASPLPSSSFGREIDAYARYHGQEACLSREQPGVVAFRRLLQQTYGANGGGILRSCTVGGRSEHKEGRAYDWMLNANRAADRAKADEFLGWLLATDQHGNRHAMARRMGVMYIIWDRQVWSAYRPDQGWQPYTGASPHTDHIHFSFSWDGALQRTSYWSGKPVLDNRLRWRDVAADRYFTDGVVWLRQHRISDGWGNTGEFRPDATVTRGQMAAFLWRMMGEPAGAPSHAFTDVPPGAYYDPAVRWLTAEGITDGVGNTGLFMPDRPVRRGEMATFLWRLTGSSGGSPTAGWRDTGDGRFYDAAVDWLTAMEITNGVGSTNTFAPDRSVTRAEMAAFLHRTASNRAAWDGAPMIAPTVQFRR